jgi:transcriptional regulator with XRE-family HTH domain
MEIEHKITLGERFRNLRKSQELSQIEMAKLLNFKTSVSVSNIESNKTPPDIQTVIKLGGIFDVDLHWLITGSPAPGTMDAIKTLKPFIYSYLSTITKKIQEAEEQCTKIRQQNTDAVMHNLANAEQVQAWLTAGGNEQKKIEDLHAEYKAITDAINEALKQFGGKI